LYPCTTIMIDTRLINAAKELLAKERKIKGFKRRFRVKGRVTAKGLTKKGNITLTIQKDTEKYRFTVLKSHKERYAIAEKLEPGMAVSAVGIPRLRMIICTRLTLLGKGIDDTQQMKLTD
jgi:hypothetical protein